jgi:sensory rhodopsin
MDEIMVFQIGAIIFGLSSFIFLYSGRKKSLFDTEFFISFITATSYALMSLSVATTVSSEGQIIYWSRWLFYLVACPLLVYDITKILNISREDYPKLALLTGLTMFNGFLASFIVTSSRWLFFLLSSIAFICLLFMIFKGETNTKFKSLKPFVLVGWSLFPLVFLLAPTGFGIIDTSISETLYFVLDLITKLFFGFMTIRMK